MSFFRPRQIQLSFFLGIAIVVSADPRADTKFHNDIAPIIQSRCATCHHHDGPAPFPLITYDDVAKRGRQIREVIDKGYMPPWPPAEGFGEFQDSLRLLPRQESQLLEWLSGDMPPGDPSAAPQPPTTSSSWQLGTPDRTLTMGVPFRLPAEGEDVYRNFVIGNPEPVRRYVRGLEMRPNNQRAVHHAFVKVNTSGSARALDRADEQPGYEGMDSLDQAVMPAGHFLSWQPGKRARFVPEDIVWILEPGADLVVQMHLRPTGKPEPISAEIGLWFTNQPPTRPSMRLGLVSYTMDIPPGVDDYRVQESFRVPVPIDILAVLPHAHYLGKLLQGYATLPNGERRWLIRIPDWNFDWQGDYQYQEPVRLPAGSTLHLDYVYDNSTNNVRNPHDPPQRVRYGKNTTDEMAELWFQVMPANDSDVTALRAAYQTKQRDQLRDFYRFRIRIDPDDFEAHHRLGQLLLADRSLELARTHLEQAGRLMPDNADPHYFLGIQSRLDQRPAAAIPHFKAAIDRNPRHFKAHGNLGLIYYDRADYRTAARHFAAALKINPNDALAREYLTNIRKLLQAARSSRSNTP